jgi:hypothetical protein
LEGRRDFRSEKKRSERDRERTYRGRRAVADGVCDRARERDERFENGDEREKVTREREKGETGRRVF